MKARATAHANIALVKYWGKRDRGLNLPARGSLSLTLSELSTTTEVVVDESLSADTLSIDGAEAGGSALARVSEFLDLVRARAKREAFAHVVSSSTFPTASGLASSASAFAALAVAATRAFEVVLTDREMTVLARKGSGSAARSLHGGLVRMYAGDADDDAHAEAIASPWSDPETSELRMVVGIVGGGAPKKNPSRDAMEHCAETSPLYAGWLDTVDPDLARAEAAIAAGDLPALGAVVEGSALAMHASMWAARPPIRYWQPTTLALIDRVIELRASGLAAFYTIDAGPHVKVLSTADDARAVADAVGEIADRVIITRPGPGALP